MTSKEALEMLKNCGTNTVEPYESKILEVLEKLVERDTPKKPIINIDNGIREHNCSVCVCRLNIPQLKEVNFCPKCGQRLMWGDENE